MADTTRATTRWGKSQDPFTGADGKAHMQRRAIVYGGLLPPRLAARPVPDRPAPRRGRRRPVCPHCKSQRRIQRFGSRTVHRLVFKIRHGQRTAARYTQEDHDETR